MSCLEKWLFSYLGEDYGGRVCWKNGERFADALASIDQVWFSKLRSKMRPHSSTSWVFMQGNLKRIMVAIRGYYSRHLGLVLRKEREPVLGLIARVGDTVQLEKMMLLVLGCAVTGIERGRHIRKILSMEKEIKTEILLKVKSLDLEVTLMTIKIAEKKSIDIYKKIDEFNMRKDSNDSGIELEEACYDEVRISDIDSVSIVTTADFSCQHDGFFETTFDEHDKDDTSKIETNFIKINRPEMADFECQFDSSAHKTSNIIDVDDSFDIANKNDIGTDPCPKLSVDASTDPMFEDSAKIYRLEQLVSELELLLLDKLGKDATISEYEKKVKNLRKMYGVANMRYQKTKQELEELKLVLRMSVEERDYLRTELKQMSCNNRNVDDRVRDFESKLESALAENTSLLENKKELEDRIWTLELEQKRQSYNSENLLRLQLNCSTSDRLRRQMIKMSNDCISTTSSGFASGSETPKSNCGLQILALPPHGDNLRELQEETERLSELIGVMEVREEQLLEEVEEVVVARNKAEEKVKEKEDELLTREQKDQKGRRVKNALLLTAAFGAVHQAIQPELVMGCGWAGMDAC